MGTLLSFSSLPHTNSDRPEASGEPGVSPRESPTLLSGLWERHKNPMSWVARPLFGSIMFYGAWIHSWWVLALGIVGVATSWFWFPRPGRVPRWVEKFIDVERAYVSPPWNAPKLLGFLVTFLFVAFTIVSFWQRRPGLALAMVIAGCLLKAGWSLAVARGAAIGAALFGLISAAIAALILRLA